jgi:flavin-dependent dehydrogenase
MTHDEVLVVGAGPAGSVAALVLARAGVRVRLIDRALFPRDKLCGDTLNPGALSILDRLQVAAPVRQRALEIAGMMITGPGNASVAAAYPDGLRGAALSRRELDMLLVEAAVAAGARFEAGVTVRHPLLGATPSHVTGARISQGDRDGDSIARVVIAADGRHSRLAFAMGFARYAARPRRWAFGAYFTDVGGLSDLGEMHVRDDGYIGVAPLPCGIANVCVVRDLATLRDRRRGSSSDFVDSSIRSDPALRERFRRAQRVSPVTSLGPLAVDGIAAGCAGLLLAGDAAGFVDPMTGDGLRFAVRGGELAAEAALRELSTGEPAHASLWAARTSEFGRKWRLNRALRTLVGSSHAVGVAAQVARQWSAPVKLLVRMAGDVNLVHRVSP